MRIIKFIGKCFRRRNESLLGKILLISVLWSKVEDDFRAFALKQNNVKALEICLLMDAIPPKIKEFVIVEYLRRAQMINGIFFYAQRIINSEEFQT